MPRFNFNEITKSGKADIDLIGQNFQEIEEKAITDDSLKTILNNYIDKSKDNNFIIRSDKDAYKQYDFLMFRSGNLIAIRLFYTIRADTITQEDIYNGKYSFTGMGDWFIPNSNYTKIKEIYPLTFKKSLINSGTNITVDIHIKPTKDYDDDEPEPEYPNAARYTVNISLNGDSSATIDISNPLEFFALYVAED